MIICGTDFSQQGAEAVEVAAAIAARLGEELRIVYAFDKKSAEQILASAEEVVLTTIRRRLRNEVDRVRKGNASVEGEILTGAPDEAVAQLAESSGASLLVLGAVGSRSASLWTLGSVAERTARSAPCPVLIVRDAQPFVSWARGERTLRVVVGYDQSAPSDAAARWVQELRRVAAIDAVFAHVYSPLEEARRLGMRVVPVGEDSGEVGAVVSRELTGRLEQLGEPDPKVVIHANLGRAADPLVQIAHDQNCDLLIVGSNQRGTLQRARHGSVSYTALHLARMSVASIPAAEASQREGSVRPGVRRVLAATDLTPLGDRAVAWAASMVPAGGILDVIHVTGSKDDVEVRRRVEAAIPRDLTSGKTVHIDLAEGDAAEEICQAAEREGVDLICVGSKRRGLLEKVVLGSVAESVLRRTSRPVLIVRDPD
jgi:nucleotide-binding universal stress UspA family protein